MSALEEILENIDFAVSLISISLTLNIFETSYIRFIANVSLLRIFFLRHTAFTQLFTGRKKIRNILLLIWATKCPVPFPPWP